MPDAELALTVVTSFAVGLAVNVTIVLAVALVVGRLAARCSASLRHLIYSTALLIVIALPLAQLTLPAVPVAAVTAPAIDIREMQVRTDVTPDVVVDPRPKHTSSKAASSLQFLPNVLRWGWLVGVVLSLGAFVIGLDQLRRIRRTAIQWPEGQKRCDELAAALGLHHPVAVRCHPDVISPIACGIVRPVILLPRPAMEWSAQTLRQALRHELEHIRRFDVASHTIARIVCALYWFHPLCWTVRRRLRMEAERACDDAVVRTAASESYEYASLLLQLARQQLHSPSRPGPAMADRADLSVRVAAILDTRQSRSPVEARVVATVVVAATLVIVGTAPLTFADIREPIISDGAMPDAAPPRNSPSVTPSLTQSAALARSANGQNAAPAARTQPTFELASVRPAEAGVNGFSISDAIPGQFSARNVPLRFLILWAFNLREHQLVMNDATAIPQGFDISARYSSEYRRTDVATMVQALLAQRFNLKVHRETRNGPVYALTLMRADGTLGPNLRRTEVDCVALREQRAREGNVYPQFGFDEAVPACLTVQRDRLGVQQLVTGGRTMAEFARSLSSIVGRDVIDRTELQGTFDIELTWSGDTPHADTAAGAPALFTALREQLHLGLAAERGPVEIVVVDSAARPTPN